MEQEFKVEKYDYTFRISKMNAIEILALQTQMSWDNADDAKNAFNLILEHLEVDCDGKWLPVKTKNLNLYYPAELESNYDLVKKLVDYFLNQYLRPVFRKSNESNE